MEVQKLSETQSEEDRLALYASNAMITVPKCLPWLYRLQQLVDYLKPDERHALARMINIKNDRLAALPIELVVQILSNLHTLYVWKLRSVSRQWRDLLSSEQIVGAALHRWNTHRPGDRVRTSHESSDGIFRRMQSWQLGRPFTKCVKHVCDITSNGHQLHQVQREYALSGHYFAYTERLPEQTHRIVVLNLLAGTQTKYQGAARETIMSFSLTNSIIAYINFNGKLYTSRHDHSQLGSVQLPSAGVTAFSADGDTVGVILQATSSSRASIVTYNCVDRTMHDFEIDPLLTQSHPHQVVQCWIRVLLISEAAGTVDLFGQQQVTTDVAGKSQSTFVEHRRYNFTGEHMSSSSWSSRDTRSRSPRGPEGFSITDLQHTGDNGVYVFRTRVLQSADQLRSLQTGKPPQQMLLCFNADEAKLMEHLLPSDYQQSLEGSYGDGLRANFACPMLWKNVEIHADIVLHFSTVSDTDRYKIRNSLQLRSRANARPSVILVNESFVVATSWLSQPQELHADIFCFEEGLDWKVHGSEVTSTYLWDATMSQETTDHGR